MIGQTISDYRITEKLGEGGMGVVYNAEDTKLDRPVALKFLTAHLVSDEDVRKRFECEAKGWTQNTLRPGDRLEPEELFCFLSRSLSIRPRHCPTPEFPRMTPASSAKAPNSVAVDLDVPTAERGRRQPVTIHIRFRSTRDEL